MIEDKYRDWVKTLEIRMRDMFLAEVNRNMLCIGGVVLRLLGICQNSVSPFSWMGYFLMPQ